MRSRVIYFCVIFITLACTNVYALNVGDRDKHDGDLIMGIEGVMSGSATWIIAADSSTVGIEILESFGESGYRNPRVLVQHDCLSNSNQNLSYFDREIQDSELYDPSSLIVQRCGWDFTVIVSSEAATFLANLRLTMLLLSNRLVRPKVDTFIQILTSPQIEIFIQSKSYRRFRNINFLVINEHDRQNSEFLVSNCYMNSEKPCRHLLEGIEIVAAITSFPEKIRFHSKRSDGTLLQGEGVYYEIFKACSRQFNFTYKVVAGGGDGATGRRLVNGHWTGAVGDIFYRQVDLGIMIGSSEARHRVLDLTTNLDMYTRIFYIRIPPRSFTWKSIYLPFDPSVWALVFSAGILFILTIYTSSKFSDYKLGNRKFTGRNLFSRILISTFKILLDQCTTLVKWQGTRIRFLIFLVSTFGLLIGTAYRSKLMSSLTRPSTVSDLPRTHYDLAYSDYTLYFCYYGGAIYQYTAASKDPVHQTIFSRMLLINSSAECIMRTLMNDRSACLDYSQAGDYAISSNTSMSATKNPTLFIKSEDADLSVGVTWAFPKGSPLTDYFNMLILRLISVGLKGAWTAWDEERNKVQSARWMMSQGNTELKSVVEIYTNGDSIRRLPLNVFYGVAFIFIFALIITLIIFSLELARIRQYYYKSKNRFVMKLHPHQKVLQADLNLP